MNFKEQLKEDLDIFINPDEFGEYHLINGIETLIVMDNDSLLDNAKDTIDGKIIGDYLYYVKIDDMDEQPMPDEYQEFDRKSCTVVSSSDVGGLYKVVLQMNGSNY